MPKPSRLPVVGWREWVALPDLGVTAIKVKVDTGARSSSLHAIDVSTVERRGREFVRFRLHPFQRDADHTVEAEARLVEYRHVRSSSGERSIRPVIVTAVELLGERFAIELTLASRDEMGFRMLLGRAAVRRRFVVDPGRSFLAGKPKFKRPAIGSGSLLRKKPGEDHREG
jgi:hypothetical protein